VLLLGYGIKVIFFLLLLGSGENPTHILPLKGYGGKSKLFHVARFGKGLPIG
jgi:hypothetical protein